MRSSKKDSGGSFSATDYVLYDQCPLKYHLKRGRQEFKTPGIWQIIGDTTHAAANSESDEDIEALLSPLNEEDRERVRKLAASVAEDINESRRRRMSSGKVLYFACERQYIHLDRASGWLLYAKPDETLVMQMDDAMLAQITDIKSGGSPKKKKNKRSHILRRFRLQLYFFALVWSKCYGWKGPIKLVADCQAAGHPDSGQAGQDEFFYDSSWNDSLLIELRSIFKEIEATRRTGRVRCRLGSRCAKCEVRGACPAYKKWKLQGSDVEPSN